MSEAGPALLAIGRGRGDNRAADAARAAISSPLLDISIQGARGVLFNIVGGKNLTLQEVNAAAQVIKDVVDPDAEIVFGAAMDPELGDEIKVTVIATGFTPVHAVSDATEETEERQEPAAALRPLRPDAAPALDTELPTFLRRSVTAR
jgi:cell division protein FtsZ